MTTTDDGQFTPGTNSGPVLCLFCHTVVDVTEGSESTGWPVFNCRTVCDECSERLEKEAPIIADGVERMLSILSPLEREVLTLRYGVGDAHAHSIAELGRRFEITPERVAEIVEQALEKTRSFAQKNNPFDRL